jgi:hypothetical protein
MTRSCVPRLERLEDRTVPSTLTVVNNLDSGPGSLRAAIVGAHLGDTITFAPSLTGQTITLTSGPLNISGQVTVTGLGAANLTIDGQHNTILNVFQGATASISGLTFTHSSGAINNGGLLTLTNDAFTANQAVNVQGAGGGAIANGGILTLSHDTFTGNTATAAAGASVFGGALWNSGQAAIDHCTFQNNEAIGGGGTPGNDFDGSFGGAIANSGGKLTVTTSRFTGNEAIGGAGALRAGGGAIDNDNTGQAINEAGNPDIATASIADCTFDSNHAGGDGAGQAEGGAIINQGQWSSMTVTNCMLSSNVASSTAADLQLPLPGPNGIGIWGEAAGGGIANLDGAVLSVSGSQLTGNSALGGNSGEDNPNLAQGGGIFNASAVLTIADSALSGNKAVGGDNVYATGGDATGGAIENLSSASNPVLGKLTLLHCTLINNVAMAGHGGGAGWVSYPASPAGFAGGGGIDDAWGSTASVVGCTLIANQAVGGDAGDGADGGNAMGGGILVGYNQTETTSLALSASTLIGNTAVGGAGGQQEFTPPSEGYPVSTGGSVSGGYGGTGSGGGLAVQLRCTAIVTSTQIAGNFARGGAGAGGNNSLVGLGYSGGIAAMGTVTLDPTVVSAPPNIDSSPSATGAPPPPPTLMVTSSGDSGPGSLRAALASAPSGSTIAFTPGLSGKTITLTSGPLTITGNVTINGPGAASLTIDGRNYQILQVAQGATAAIAGITFTHGMAKAGGAISNGGALLLTNDTFTANQAVGGLGGGAIDNTGSLTLNHDLFNANRATAAAVTAATGTSVAGGAVLNSGQAQISNCTFQNNQAVGGGVATSQPHGFSSSAGGAIANSAGDIAINASTFTNNETISVAGYANAGGGAIDNDNGANPATGPGNPILATAAVADCTFSGNQALGGAGATAQGGAIFNRGVGSIVTLSASMITSNRALADSGGAGDANSPLADAAGGGVANLDGALVTIDNSQLSGNQAVGAASNVPVPTWQYARALGAGAGMGGGIFNGNAGLTALDSTLTSNRAQGGNNSTGLGSGAEGGAIANGGDGADWPFGYLDLAGTTLMNNVAFAGRGGTQATGFNNGFAAGGGIDDSLPGADTILGCSLIGNQAIGATGGSGQNGGPAMGGAIEVLDSGSQIASLLLSASTLLGNRAIGGTGGTAATVAPPPVGPAPGAPSSIGGQGGYAIGGGLAVVSNHISTPAVTVSAAGSQVTGNFARGGTRGIGGTTGHGIGGGTWSSGWFALDPFTVVTKNHASTSNNDTYP